MNKLLKSYVKRLTNLTSNNKSLFMAKVTELDLDLHEFHYLNNEPSFFLIQQIISGKSKIPLCNVIDSRNAASNGLSKQLKGIQRREKMVLEERGAKDLYVAWPFVLGRLRDGTIIRCPLLFFPVDLVEENNFWYIQLRKNNPVTFNKSFLAAFSHFNQIKIEEDLIESTLEDFSNESRVFITMLYEALKKSAIELHFNQNLFQEELTPFETLTKKVCEETLPLGILKLQSEAVLGLFPQSGSFLFPDYEFLIHNHVNKTLEDFFKSKPEAEKNGNYSFRLREEQTFAPFQLDASQEEAMRLVKSGMSLVVQGPPGTGKSQLICNLVCDYIARGKKVLVVCQKKAALEVVYDRLKDLGISNFIGLVHDFKNDRIPVFEKINFQIEQIEYYKKENNSLNSVQLERQFLQCSRNIDGLVETLTSFKNALFEISSSGFSAKELYLSSNAQSPTIDVALDYVYFDSNSLKAFGQKIKNFYQYWQKIGTDHIWKNRKSFAKLNSNDQFILTELIDQIPEFYNKIGVEFHEKFKISFSKYAIKELEESSIRASELIRQLNGAKEYEAFRLIYTSQVSKKLLEDVEQRIIAVFESEIEKTIPSSLFTNEKLIFEEAYQKRKKSYFKWFHWKITSRKYRNLEKIFAQNNLKSDLHGFHILAGKINKRWKLEKLFIELDELKFEYVPRTFDKEVLLSWVLIQKDALKARIYYEASFPLTEIFEPKPGQYAIFIKHLSDYSDIINTMRNEETNWKQFFDSDMIAEIKDNTSYRETLKTSLKNDFDILVEFDQMIESLPTHELNVLHRLTQCCKNFDDAINLFENSIRCKWLIDVENKYPILRSVSSLKMEQMEQELQNNIAEKSGISKHILTLRIKEHLYKSNTFNRLSNRVTYRELKHQVSKKRKVWPIRKVVDNFADELFTLMPCWLASPESVSAIFSMQQQFDLVIFDEASQCFTEKGIPALYRGRQIVITGDSQQLRPNDLYQTRFEEEDEMPDVEVESLLDLGHKYLHEVHLTQHYRSSSAELIQFSNVHFYKNSLEVLPEFNKKIINEPAIEYVLVNGFWNRGVNELEADKVVQLVKHLIIENKITSIGVITFNYKQAEFIQDLLEYHATKDHFIIPEKLFVKNIENVQGDEREVIIFSVGYAPDSHGKMTMQFGSLNQVAGANRLNVAITRAKRKIYLVTSIMPAQLKINLTVNDGPKLFKNYLEYAYNVSNNGFVVMPIQYPDSSSWYLTSQLKPLVQESTDTFLNEHVLYGDSLIEEKGKLRGLLLTDDNKYFESPSVKDYHAYKPIRLRNIGWNFLKIYSRNYWLDRNTLKDLVVKGFNKTT